MVHGSPQRLCCATGELPAGAGAGAGQERPLPANRALGAGAGWQPEQRRNFLLCYFYIHSVTQPATSARLGPARECHSGRCVLVYICCGYVDLYKVNSRCRPWQCDDESYLFINPQGLYKIICMGGLLSCCIPHKAIEHHIIIVTPTSSDFELLPTVNRTQLDTGEVSLLHDEGLGFASVLQLRCLISTIHLEVFSVPLQAAMTVR